MPAGKFVADVLQGQLGVLAGEIENRVAGHHQILLAAAGGQLLGREPKTFAHLADNGIHIHKRIVKAVLRQNFLRHFHGNGTAKQLGLEQQVMHAAFQLPDIPGEALGQHIHHRIGQQRVVLAGLLLKDTAARAGVGLFNTGEEPRTETRHEAVVHVSQLAGRKGTRQDDAAPLFLQGLDGGKHLILHLFLALEEVHVLKEQQIHVAETPLEAIHGPRLEGLHETARKLFGGQIFDLGIGAVAGLAQSLPHGLREVRLAEPRPGAEEQGIHGGTGTRHVARRGIGHVIGGADHKAVERVPPVVRDGLVHGHGDRQGKLLGSGRKQGRSGHRTGRGSRTGTTGRSGLTLNGDGRTPRNGTARLGGRIARNHADLHRPPENGGSRIGNVVQQAIAYPRRHKSIGGGQTDLPLPFKVGGERRNPNLVGAGIEPVLQIFTDFEPLSFHIRFF